MLLSTQEGLKSRERGVAAHPPLDLQVEEIWISSTCRRKGISKSHWKQHYVKACFSTSNCSIQEELEAGTMKQTIIISSLHEPVDYCEQPVILAGDFNVNFSLPEAEPLLKFLDENFSLEMINGKHDPKTNGGTVIDAIFARDLPSIDIKHRISSFSFHNPIVNIIDMSDPYEATIDESQVTIMALRQQLIRNGQFHYELLLLRFTMCHMNGIWITIM
ncbi:hypothetical protein PV328_007688 [Microctonus aethiopoides]|uniref:Endonuclease/exonuclease/phosphatase domain-containing protein n=1 Tax=Microctonus aethiopoides TaxID=144406 RepID=A0AA39F0R3_9HYME|nr:hypothetical protein PV328_007688 [Microctonus aethiopoides]